MGGGATVPGSSSSSSSGGRSSGFSFVEGGAAARGVGSLPQPIGRPPHPPQASLPHPLPSLPSDDFPPLGTQTSPKNYGLRFLPHTLLPSRRPSSEPPAEALPPPAPEPEHKVPLKPAKQFRIPIPSNLPPGPWLPEEIISVDFRPATGGNHIAPHPPPARNHISKSGFDNWKKRHQDYYSRANRGYHHQNLQARRSTYPRPPPPASRDSYVTKPTKPQEKKKSKEEWVVKRRQDDQKDSSGETSRREDETREGSVSGSIEASSRSGGFQSDYDESVHAYNLAIDGFEERDSSEPELEIKKEVEDFDSENYFSSEDDVLANQLADTMTLTSDLADDSLIVSSRDSRIQIASSDSFEEQPALSHWTGRYMGCRADIETLTADLLSVYESLIPGDEEKRKQNQLIDSLTQSVKNEWPDTQLYLYGSCANAYSLSSSDIDVCLAINESNMNKPDMLLKLADMLQSEGFHDVEAILNARVPIIRMIDPASKIACDICINNSLALANTKLLKDYAKIDARLPKLAFLVKHWAKSRGLNNTYRGTLSSYAYVLMCIHFLQLCKPSILPCLQEMEATYDVIIDNFQCAYFDDVETLSKFGAKNSESLARLIWEFFHYWAYEHDYKNGVISVRTGRVISKQSKNWKTRTRNDYHLLSIEDPFETSHDLGRRVDKYSIQNLREEFERAACILQYDPNPHMTLFEHFATDSAG